MFESQFTRNLKEGEELVRVVRRYPGSMAWSIVLVALLLLAPFFFLFPLLRLGVGGVIGFVVLLGIGLILLLRTLIVYSLNALVLTNQRIIDLDQKGFFHRVVSETGYDKVQDVSFSIRGVPQTLFHYGTLLIQTAGAQTNIEIRNVRNPEKIQELVQQLQKAAPKNSADGEEQLSAQELIGIVQKLKRGLGDDEFERLTRSSRRKT